MRDLRIVIQQMLDLIPDDEAMLRATLKRMAVAELYVAPEDQGWSAVAWVLARLMEPHRSEINPEEPWDNDWCEPVLKIWRDEK